MNTPLTQKRTILVIDDEEAVRDTICENLGACGFDVVEAIDGEQALQLIDPGNLPRVVITDMIMPRQEGLETIIRIRKLYPTIKLIAISGGGSSKAMDFLDLAKRLGADTILSKPLDFHELERTVKRLAD
jgi:two-component system, chemotaxis family, chemotaxis protein CheY